MFAFGRFYPLPKMKPGLALVSISTRYLTFLYAHLSLQVIGNSTYGLSAAGHNVHAVSTITHNVLNIQMSLLTAHTIWWIVAV